MLKIYKNNVVILLTISNLLKNVLYLSISMDNWSRWHTSLIVSKNIKVLIISEHPIGKKNQTAFECISKKTVILD